MCNSLPQNSKVCTKCKEWKDRFRSNKQTRDKLASWCRDCEAELARKTYAKNPERDKENTRKYRAEHAEQERQRMKEYNARYYEENKDRVIRRVKVYVQANPEKVEQTRKSYLSTPIGRANKQAAHHRRRSLKMNAPGNYTATEWQALCSWFGDKCLKCGNAEITIDHVIPLIKGGSNAIDNLQPLCMSCNSSKRDKIADYRDSDRLAAFLDTL